MGPLKSFRISQTIFPLFILLPVAFLISQGLRTEYKLLTDLTFLNRESIAELASSVLDKHFDRLKEVGRSFATRVQFRKLVEEKKWDEAIKIFRGVTTQFPDIYRVVLADMDGKETADEPPSPETINAQAGELDWFRGTKKSGDQYVSEVYRSLIGEHQFVFGIGTPIKSDDGRSLGLLLLQVNLKTLSAWSNEIQEETQRVHTKQGGNGSPALENILYFVDRSGHLVTHIELNPNSNSLLDLRSSTAVTKVLAGIGGIELAEDPVRKTPSIVSFAPLLEYGWGVVCSEPTSAAFASRNDQITRVVIEDLIILLLTSALAYGFIINSARRQKSEEGLRKAKDEADSANRAKSDFLARMSHDIRTPLNGVIGMCDLLLGTELKPQQHRYTQILKSSAHSLATLINDILDFSKIEAGKLELAHIEFNLHNAIEEVASTLSFQASKKGLELICYIHPAVPEYVKGDPDRLWQILVNLVNNAVKFTETGHVTIKVSTTPGTGSSDHVRFEVLDSGIGIPADKINRLFSAFTQADVSTTRKFGGTGLGLAICKQLVEMMHGKIGVTSDLGKGSTFWFTVQFEPAGMETAKSPTKLELRDREILLVDDNETNLEILKQQLADLHFNVITSSSGTEGLDKLRASAKTSEPVSLVITDFNMPGMNGLEFAHSIKAERFQNVPPIILLSSVANDFDQKTLDSAGVVSVLSKPARQSKLFDSIMSALGRRSIREEPSNQGTRQSPGASQYKILVAEDNEVNRIVISELLANAGFAHDLVEDGEQAIRARRSKGYDLILMDCGMPNVDGLDATREIRKWESDTGTKRIPIVALTANAQVSFKEECIRTGMDAFCSKPIDPRNLLTVLGEQLPDLAEDRIQSDPHAELGIELTRVIERCGGKRDVARLVMEKFREQLGEDLPKLQMFVEAGDKKKIAALAHSIRGSANMAGAPKVGAAAQALEECAKEEASGSMKDLLSILKDKIQATQRSIDEAIQSLIVG